MLEDIKEITYRGYLKSCNYSCSYCVFSKNKMTKEEIDKDKKSLDRFEEKIMSIKFNNPLNIFIAPYGEALIHDYYSRSISNLSNNKNIKVIGVQTNLSWNDHDWIELLKVNNADLSKITLWCTYHPSMTDINTFVKKIKYLSQYINLSVGAVGDINAIEEIQKLRKLLPIQIYLWINNMDGVRKRYSEDDINKFKEIDPLFNLELNVYDKTYTCECTKNHRFIKANGDLYYCNRNIKKIGNLYNLDTEKNELINNCTKRRCDCYLSYSHLSNLKEMNFFGNQGLVRVPERRKIKAIFLDLDGTILEKDGHISDSTKSALKYISTKSCIYLATARPYEKCFKKYSELKEILSGGIFADGAHILDTKNKYEKFFYIPVLDEEREDISYYNHNKKCYKLFTRNKNVIEKYSRDERYNVNLNRGKAGITLKSVSKLSSINHLCRELSINEDEIMVVGNDYNDIEMISNINQSAAVNSSPEILKEKAKYILDVKHLPYII